MGGEIDNSWVAWKNQAKSLNRESVFWKSIFLLCRRMTAMIALYILFIQLICAFSGLQFPCSFSSLKHLHIPNLCFVHLIHDLSISPAEPSTPFGALCTAQTPLRSSWIYFKMFCIYSTIWALTSEHRWGRSRTLQISEGTMVEEHLGTQFNARWAYRCYNFHKMPGIFV